MKRILFASFLASSLLGASAYGAPVAILTQVSGEVVVQRGVGKLVGKNGLQLEKGDKVTVKSGSATVFSLGLPPRTLNKGVLVVGQAPVKAASSSVWSVVYKGLQHGLNAGDRRAAATMRPGEILPVGPVRTLVETPRPVFEWRALAGIQRYEVVVTRGAVEIWRGQSSRTRLSYPAGALPLAGSLNWRVVPLRWVDGKWKVDAGGSEPVNFGIATAAQIEAVQGELGALEAVQKLERPALRFLARAVIWNEKGFHDAALKELEHIGTDSTAVELRNSIWWQTGQSWRLPVAVPVVKESIGGADPAILALTPEAAPVIGEVKKFASADGLFTVDIPVSFTAFEYRNNQGIILVDFGQARSGGARLTLAHLADNFFKKATPREQVLEMLRAGEDGKDVKLEHFEVQAAGATTFGGRAASLFNWRGTGKGRSAEGKVLEWKEGGLDYFLFWGAGNGQTAGALFPLLKSFKIVHGKPAPAPQDDYQKSLLIRMLLISNSLVETINKLSHVEDTEFYEKPWEGPSPTVAVLEELEKKRLAAAVNSYDRGDAAVMAARVAARLGWEEMGKGNTAAANQFFERNAALKAEAYKDQLGAVEADVMLGDAELQEWLHMTVPGSLADSYYSTIHQLRMLRETRFIHLQTLAAQNLDFKARDRYARELFELRRDALESQKLAPVDAREMSDCVTSVAGQLDNLGNYAKSHADLYGGRAYFDLALRWRKSLPDSNSGRDIVSTLDSRATLERALGADQIALKCYGEALAEIKRLDPIKRKEFAAIKAEEQQFEKQSFWEGDHAGILASLGDMTQDQGDFAAAEAYFQEALGIYEGMNTNRFSGFMRTRGKATIYDSLASLHSQEGDSAGAGKYMEMAVENYRLIGDNAGLAGALWGGADIDFREGNYEAAKGKLRDARSIFERLQLPLRVMSCDLTFARIARKQGDEQRAADLAQKCLETARALNDANGISSAAQTLALAKMSLLGVGKMTPELKVEVEALIKEAGVAIGRLCGAYPQMGLLLVRAQLAFNGGDNEGAYQLLRDVILRNERMRATAASAESFAEQSENYALYDNAVRLLLKLNRPEEAFDMLSRARSRKLRAELSLRQLKSNDPALQALLTKAAALDEQLAKTRAQLETETALPAPQRDQNKIKNLGELIASTQQEFFDVSEQIRAKNPRFEKALSLSPTELKKAQRAIPEGSLLLQYAVLDNGLYIFAVTRSSLQIFAPKVSRDELNKQIRDYRALMDSDIQHLQKGEPISNIDEAGSPIRLCSEQLSKWLLEPVQKEIDAAKTVAIIPSGELFYLPFHALGETVKGENGSADKWRFLIESKPVAYLTSGDVLSIAQSRDVADESQGVLALGDPTGADLPESKVEVERIVSLFPRSKALTGAGATKDILLQPENRDKRVLHLAAHGVLDSAHPRQSFIQLSPSGKDDGKLRVGEIVGLDLNKVDLVTLSACRTALGEGSPDGTEISSLAQSFASAGTPSVIASLWSVEDKSTAQLMEAFYKVLVDETPKGVALQRAQVGLLRNEKTRQPVYWAPFELMGDWR